jgi:hypothetical protein
MLEGQVALQRNGSTKNLSPQQLIDCDMGNNGWCVSLFLVVRLSVLLIFHPPKM